MLMLTARRLSHVSDVRQGLVDADSKVADMLRRSKKPVVLVVNKVDNFDKFMPDVYEFYNLGIGDPVPISAASRLGIGDMLDEVVSHFPEGAGETEEDERPKIAIVGKPNVGKSSIVNKLLGENRVKSAEVAMEQVRTDLVSAQTMPFDTGDMQNNQTFVHADESGASLVTGSPQARRLYYHPEYHFQKGNNPNAGAAWLEPYITGSKKDLAKNEFVAEFKKRTGV